MDGWLVSCSSMSFFVVSQSVALVVVERENHREREMKKTKKKIGLKRK